MAISPTGGATARGKKGGTSLGDGCPGRVGKPSPVSPESGNSTSSWVVVVSLGGAKFLSGCTGEVGGSKGGGATLSGGGKLLG